MQLHTIWLKPQNSYLMFIHTIGEKNIGATKIKKIFAMLSNCYFFQYCAVLYCSTYSYRSSNFAMEKVVILKFFVSLLISFFFTLVFFLCCSLYSYRSYLLLKTVEKKSRKTIVNNWKIGNYVGSNSAIASFEKWTSYIGAIMKSPILLSHKKWTIC